MLTNLLNKIAITIVLLFPFVTSAQELPDIVPKTPTPAKFRVVNPSLSPSQVGTSTVVVPRNNMTRHQQQLAQFERDRQEVMQREAETKKMYADLVKRNGVQYSFPNFKNKSDRQYYKQAFEKLNQMNPDNFSVKEANFVVENAYYNNSNNYNEYEKVIKNSKDFIEQAMKQRGQDLKNNLAKNLTIFQFMADTLKVGDLEHKPFTYDFEDYRGQKDWRKMLVQKLIEKGSGQCNSMPRLFLILAEELQAESYLAFAPNHSYIMFQDLKNNWYNAELTNGALTTDAIMFNANYIKSEAIINKAYATPQTKRQVMSHLYNDLAMGYMQKFGVDEFVEEMIDKSLELNPNGITGNILRNNYLFALLRYVGRQLNAPNEQSLQPYPKALEILNKVHDQDDKLRNIGFDPIPEELYKKWLEQIKKAKEEQKKKYLEEFNNQIRMNQNKLKG